MKELVGFVVLSVVGLSSSIKVAPETFLKGCTLFDQEGKQSIFSHFHTSTLRNNHALKQDWIRMKAFYIGSPYGPQIGISDKSHLYTKSIIYSGFVFLSNTNKTDDIRLCRCVSLPEEHVRDLHVSRRLHLNNEIVWFKKRYRGLWTGVLQRTGHHIQKE